MDGMIKCPRCGAILHSLYRHDFQQCDCESETFVDGGDDYMRLGGDNIDSIIIVKHKHLPDGGVMLLED